MPMLPSVGRLWWLSCIVCSHKSEAEFFKNIGKLKRFADSSDAVIEGKRKKSAPMAITKANEKAKRILVDFGSVTPVELETVLSKFYPEARTAIWNRYKSSSLVDFELQSLSYDRNINAVKYPAFRQCNETFRTAMRELKGLGNGEVDSYPQITLCDLRKIYNLMSCDSPKSLADKVQFDIRFYFCHRGCENMHAMTKDAYEVCVDGERNEFGRQAREYWIKNAMKAIVKVIPDLRHPMPDPSCVPLPPSKTMSVAWTQCVTVFGNAPLTVWQAHRWFDVTITQLV